MILLSTSCTKKYKIKIHNATCGPCRKPTITAGMIAIIGPKLGMKVNNPAMMASISHRSTPIINKPIAVSAKVMNTLYTVPLNHFLRFSPSSSITDFPLSLAEAGNSPTTPLTYSLGAAARKRPRKKIAYKSPSKPNVEENNFCIESAIPPPPDDGSFGSAPVCCSSLCLEESVLLF